MESIAFVREFIDTAEYLRENDLAGLEAGQHPEFYAHKCGDSRVELKALVNDQLNRLFGTSVIGNQWFGILGSAAYPLVHLPCERVANNCGHVRCGAVGAAYEMSMSLKPNIESPDGLNDAIGKTWQMLRDGRIPRQQVHVDADESIKDELMPMAQYFANIRDIIREDNQPDLTWHAVANVHLQVHTLMQLRQVRDRIKNGKLIAIGTLYDFCGTLGERGRMYLVNVNGNFENLGQHPLVESLGADYASHIFHL